MSSRRQSCGCFVGEQGAVDDVGEAAAEEPERLRRRVALLDPPLDVLAAERWLARLPDRDPVERRADLAVAGTRESIAGGVARPDWLGCGSVPAGVGALGAEAAGAGGLADDLRRGQSAA